MTDQLQKLQADVLHFQKLVYQSSGLSCGAIKIEMESIEYSACSFTVNNRNVQFRVAKITPTKIGQFVTFWKRLSSGPIAPFDVSDSIDFFIVNVRAGQHFGQFVFPKSALLAHDIISKNGLGGKRALRVYPPWDKTDNKQAIKTQIWQLQYFVSIDLKNLDVVGIKKLFSAT